MRTRFKEWEVRGVDYGCRCEYKRVIGLAAEREQLKIIWDFQHDSSWPQTNKIQQYDGCFYEWCDTSQTLKLVKQALHYMYSTCRSEAKLPLSTCINKIEKKKIRA